MNWDEEFDVVSVGSGAGGLSAAITAAHSGARALVLEKTSKLGGVTARSGGEVWIGGSHVELGLGIEDSLEDTYDYLSSISAGFGDEELRRTLVGRMVDAARFLDDHADLKLQVIRNYPDYYYPVAKGAKPEGRYHESVPFDTRELGDLEDLLEVSPHGLANYSAAERSGSGDFDALMQTVADHKTNHEVCAGSALSGRLLKAAGGLGVTLRVNHEVTRLITEDGRVVGVEVSTQEGTRRIKAGGVLLATGGYDWNDKFVEAFDHVPGLKSMTAPAITGDHITMGGDVGAMVTGRPPVLTPLLLGMDVPGVEVDGHTLNLFVFPGQPHVILVNRAGERFADESFYPAVDAALDQLDGTTAQYVNSPTWYVFDQTFRDKYPVGPFGPGQDLPEGMAFVGDSPRELAEKAGFDPKGFEDTLLRFNEGVKQGVDPDFGRGERPWGVFAFGDSNQEFPVLGELEKMPLYAIKLSRVGVGIPSVGLQIDQDGRVINTRGDVIPGLYAAGNAAAPTDVPGYQSGLANIRGLTYGHYAARNIVGTAADRAQA